VSSTAKPEKKHFLHKYKSKFVIQSSVSRILKVLQKIKMLKLLLLGKNTTFQNLAVRKLSKKC